VFHIKSDGACRSLSYFLRSSSKRKRASTAIKTYKQGNIEQVSEKNHRTSFNVTIVIICRNLSFCVRKHYSEFSHDA